MDFNETVHRDLGYTREEFANLTIADLDPVESTVDVKARISRILEKGSAEFDLTVLDSYSTISSAVKFIRLSFFSCSGGRAVDS